MINSLLKALDILEVFRTVGPRLPLFEISERLGLPKSTAHNILRTLASRGYIERLDNDQYALGPALIPLARAVRLNVELRDCAAAILRELADDAGCTVYLVAPDHDRALYIFAVESAQRLLARTSVGMREPLYCTAVGKAILAFMPAEQAEAVIDSIELSPFTEATITDPDTLRKEIAEVRSRGYAVDCSEHEPGIYCVGAPIFNAAGVLIAACSVSGPDPDIVGKRCPELSVQIMSTAEEISRRTGYVSPKPSLVKTPTQPDRTVQRAASRPQTLVD